MNSALTLILTASLALSLSGCGGKETSYHAGAGTRAAKTKLKQVSETKPNSIELKNELKLDFKKYHAANGEDLQLIGWFADSELNQISAAFKSKTSEEKLPMGRITFIRKAAKFLDSYPQNIPEQAPETSVSVPTAYTAYLIKSPNQPGFWGIAIEGEAAIADASDTSEIATIRYQQSEYCDRYQIAAVNAIDVFDQGVLQYALSTPAQVASCNVQGQCSVHQTSNYHFTGLAIPDRLMKLEEVGREFRGSCLGKQLGYRYEDKRSNLSHVVEYEIALNSNLKTLRFQAAQ